MFQFCLVNRSTTTDPAFGGELTDPILQQIADAATAQMNEDIAPIWGGMGVCRIGPADSVVKGEIPVYIDDAIPDVPGAAAYHDRQPDGTPIIYAARNTFESLISGSRALSVGLTHEFAETLGDPGANRWADRTDGTSEALEISDRVEDTFYDKNGVSVTNFLFPSAFDPGSSGPYDFCNALMAGQTLTPGGYVILRVDGQAYQQTAHGLLVSAKREITIEGEFHPSKLARKRSPLSRSYRRGLRLA